MPRSATPRDVPGAAVQAVVGAALSLDAWRHLRDAADPRPADLADDDRLQPDRLLGVEIVKGPDREAGGALRGGALDEVEDAPRGAAGVPVPPAE